MLRSSGVNTSKWFSTATGELPLTTVGTARCESSGLELRLTATNGGLSNLPENLRSLEALRTIPHRGSEFVSKYGHAGPL